MQASLRAFLGARRLLLVVAAGSEAIAARTALGAPGEIPEWHLDHPTPGVDLVRTGVGKANAAGAVARFLDPSRHGAVLSAGIAGALPAPEEHAKSGPIARFGAALGEVLVASHSIFADEGLDAPTGFADCAAMGFPLGAFAGSGVPTDDALRRVLAPLGRVAPLATVSTCSGTDALARRIAARTGAAAEAMEGAGVALVALRLGVAFGEARVVSNTTGDRPSQRWELRPALARLADVIGLLAGPRP